MPETQLPIDTWAIVELFGHRKLAGYLTERQFGAAALLQVDVPETKQDGDQFTKPYTKLIGVGSIYCLTPCSEAIARAVATNIERFNHPIPVDIPLALLPTRAPADDAELVEDDDDELEEWQR